MIGLPQSKLYSNVVFLSLTVDSYTWIQMVLMGMATKQTLILVMVGIMIHVFFSQFVTHDLVFCHFLPLVFPQIIILDN